MDRLIPILKNILAEKDFERNKKLISEFQNIVWLDNKLDLNDYRYDIFNDLAVDLEYLIADITFDGEKMRKEIEDAVDKIQKLTDNQNINNF